MFTPARGENSGPLTENASIMSMGDQLHPVPLPQAEEAVVKFRGLRSRHQNKVQRLKFEGLLERQFASKDIFPPFNWLRPEDDGPAALAVEHQCANTSSTGGEKLNSLLLGWKSLEIERKLFTGSANRYCSAITHVITEVEGAHLDQLTPPLAAYCSAVEAEPQSELTRGLQDGALGLKDTSTRLEDGLALTGLKDVWPVEHVSLLLREAKEALTGLQEKLGKLQQSRRNLTWMLERKVQAKLGQRLRRLRSEKEENEKRLHRVKEENERAAAAAHRASVEAEQRHAEAKACHICMERPHNVILLSCVHAHFCSQCVEKLRTINNTCPTCRTNIMSTLEYKM